MIEKETIALIWVMSIGIAALLSSIMLVHERTQNWSERKIVFVSAIVSLIITAFVIFR